jgi:hypothetical protein
MGYRKIHPVGSRLAHLHADGSRIPKAKGDCGEGRIGSRGSGMETSAKIPAFSRDSGKEWSMDTAAFRDSNRIEGFGFLVSESVSGKRRMNTPKVRVVRSHGIILFDVDQTILDVRIVEDRRHEETLLESPTLFLIVELLGKEYRLCAITGNDLRKFTPRFTDILRDYLGKENRIHLMEHFEVYGNGAATHLTFDARGNAVPDEIYNRRFRIPDSEAKTIRSVLEAFAETCRKDGFGDLAAFESAYDRSVWKYHFDPETDRWFAEENGRRRIIPWVESRGDRAMITLKPLPSRKHIRDADELSIRRKSLDEIRKRLRDALGGRADAYAIRTGGWSSIDITLRVNKADAVKHCLSHHGLMPEEALYFGNEFGDDGNDRPVLDFIENIHVVSVNQPEAEIFHQDRVFPGGGRGVFSTGHQLSALLELDHRAEMEAASDPGNVVPVIQRMILNAHREQIARREALIRRRLSVAERMKVCREIVKVMNRSLSRLDSAFSDPPGERGTNPME